MNQHKVVSQTLLSNSKEPVELRNPNTCAECLFIFLFIPKEIEIVLRKK